MSSSRSAGRAGPNDGGPDSDWEVSSRGGVREYGYE